MFLGLRTVAYREVGIAQQSERARLNLSGDCRLAKRDHVTPASRCSAEPSPRGKQSVVVGVQSKAGQIQRVGDRRRSTFGLHVT